MGSIRSTGFGMIAATQGKPEFTNCRSDLPMHLRDARLRWEDVMVMDNGDGGVQCGSASTDRAPVK